MKILRLLKATLKNARAAAEIVKAGGLVVYPTDTVYGLGCDPFNVEAVERLLQVKGARDRPLPILLDRISNVERVAALSSEAARIAERFWPGPLTLILPRRRLPDIVTFGLPTVGVRIPNNETSRELIRLSDGVLVGTSANKSGQPPPVTAMQSLEDLKDEVDIILDGGDASLGISSTVLDLTQEQPRILRKGPVSLRDIMKTLRARAEPAGQS